eukprot:626757_1
MSATRRGVCFRNLGNTCYIDSVLILYGSDPRLVQRECECKDCVSNEFCLLKSAHNLIKRQQESKHKISPTTIYNNLHSINHGYFERNRQYDAGAFLNSLLSQIQTTLSSQISDFAAPYLHSHCTVTTCRRCKYSRNSIVPATTIQLYDLDKHNNIIQCLDDLKSEDLNDVKGNNLIRCGRCNRKTKHQMETHYIPGDTLYLCLNRSTQIDDEDEQVDAFYIKNNKYIEFYDQFEYFNKTWKMFAMVEHMGGEDDAGHCIAYRKLLQANKYKTNVKRKSNSKNQKVSEKVKHARKAIPKRKLNSNKQKVSEKVNHARKSIPKPLINAPDVADVDNKLLSNVDGEQMAGDESDSSTENSSGYSESYFEAQREKQIDDIIQRKQMKIVTIHHEQGSSKYVYELIGTQDVNVQSEILIKHGAKAARSFWDHSIGYGSRDIYLHTNSNVELKNIKPKHTKVIRKWIVTKNGMKSTRQTTGDTIHKIELIWEPELFERKQAKYWITGCRNERDVPQAVFKLHC